MNHSLCSHHSPSVAVEPTVALRLLCRGLLEVAFCMGKYRYGAVLKSDMTTGIKNR